MSFRHGAVTDVGKKRSRNEDYVCVREKSGVYVLCDGVGGSHHSGDIASRTAAEAWMALMLDWVKGPGHLKWPGQQIAAALNQIAQDVNQKVYEECSEQGGMATTLVAVWLQGMHAWICNIGDSRVYLFRGGAMHPLTEDQTFENEWVKSGTYTREVARKSPQAKTLTQAVGAQQAVKVEIRTVELMEGDRLLMCSDGLTKMIDDAGILPMIGAQGVDAAKVAKTLVDQANARGGADNVSVIVIECAGEVLEKAPVVKPSVVAAKPTTASSSKPTVRINPQFKVEAVNQVPFFQGLEYAELLKLLEISKLESFNPGDVLAEEGTPGDEMFVLLTGEVEVFKGDHFVGIKKAGITVGEMGVFDRQDRSATVKARDQVQTLVFPRDRLLTLLQANPQLSLKIMWKLVGHLNGLIRHLTEQVGSH